MPTSTSNVIFVGNGFERQFFDERGLFSAPMDSDYMAFSQAAEYTYGSGRYRFSVLPNRIAIHENLDAILSDELIKAADLVAAALKSQSRGHGVTGLGVNVDTILSQSDDGMTGIQFCSGLSDTEQILGITHSPFEHTQTHVVVLRGGVQYTLRIEPHNGSRGANLFLGVNGHQDVVPDDDIAAMLQKANSARGYIASVLSRLSNRFEGVSE